ncbi:MAG: ISKra4 family transposase [Verrucomicrobiaceae bacterium]|nr:MAG: ISKra4 family transposase [Verrucomicrobiaceae bacterium]
MTLPDGSVEMHFIVKVPPIRSISSARTYEKDAQAAAAQVGLALMEYGLAAFDTGGEPMELCGAVFSSKGRQPETYQTSFGPVTLSRHVYQSSKGGKTFAPFEERARIIGLSTPLFAASVAAKYSENGGRAVQRDLAEHHARPVSLDFIQKLAGEVASVALGKEPYWRYEPVTPPAQVPVIALGYDGTCAQTCEEGWKQVMVGTVTLYDGGGKPLETLHIANAPEDGKATFLSRMDREVAALKIRYPDALWVGVSDGATDLRAELGRHCAQLILDFWHAVGYIASAGPAMTAGTGAHGGLTASQWTDQALHRLKSEDGGAAKLLAEMERQLDNGPVLTSAERTDLSRAAGYIGNNLDRMDYAAAVREKLPIGSGITEAACKTIVKARLCGGGMRWHLHTMQQVLCLRALRRSSNRWDQFWERLDRQGY